MDQQPNGPLHVLRLTIAVEGGLAVLAVAIGWLLGFSPLVGIDFTWASFSRQATALALGIAATVPMILALLLLERSTWGPIRHLQDVVRRLVIPLFQHATLMQLAFVSAMAGVGEELFFRGLLQAATAHLIGPPHGGWIGIALSSIAFGLAHTITRTYVVLAMMIGLYFSGLFLLSSNLLAPIAAHALYDFLALAYFLKWRRYRTQTRSVASVAPEAPAGGEDTARR